MGSTFIVANWKSNKTVAQTKDWFAQISSFKFSVSNKQIIICPSFTQLELVNKLINEYNLPFKVGAQDVSVFEQGAHTGEVSAEQIKEFAEYVIIGHSERRAAGETDKQIEIKIKEVLSLGMEPILCVQNEQTPIPQGVRIVAYEPPNAISTSGPDAKATDPKDVIKTVLEIKSKNPQLKVIYGGSVNGANVNSFTKMEEIDGVLPGAASLDPKEFAEIIKNA